MNRINAPDGTPLVYDAYEPARPTAAVLFLHGWGDDAGRWATTGAQLRDAGFGAYVLDQRGHGRSGGPRAHLTRFSQLLGDLQAFRRGVRRRHDVPQVIFGHGFGGLVTLRYLETQPGEPPVAAIVASPWLRFRHPSLWKQVATRFADLWPTLRTGSGTDMMTAGARAEVRWAQRAVAADHARIECSLLLLLADGDPVADTSHARAFASSLVSPALIRSYATKEPDLLNAVLEFLASTRSSDRAPRAE